MYAGRQNISFPQQVLLSVLSFVIVAFGQPAFHWFLGLVAACCGYALFWKVLLAYPSKLHRFILATAWFTSIQFVQLAWFLSHPFLYIYSLYLFFTVMIGLQFGVLGIFITNVYLASYTRIISLACLWTVFEWLRLFFFSGYSWNPVGLALTGSLFPLQMANLWGVYGLSFLVILINLLFLRAWIQRFRQASLSMAILVAAIPYLYGFIQFNKHKDALESYAGQPFTAVLVQTTFPAEAALNLKDKKQTIAHALGEWHQIFKAVKKQAGQPIDLIVLPEYAVRCGTYSCVYPYEAVVKLFKDFLSEESVHSLPSLNAPLSTTCTFLGGESYFVNNAFIAQGLANYFRSGIVVGLEDAEDRPSGKREYYSAALFFKPNLAMPVGRYEKRVLIPLGEYIPFEFCRSLAETYGVYGSFTCGTEAKLFEVNHVPFGLSICYEETFGHLMRDNKRQGAELLVNLTNDAWYPHSRLPQQHFTHALLRSVENGIPLIRACNIGITGAVDSLGRVVTVLGQERTKPEWIFDSIRISVPTYTYQTLYSIIGDNLIIGFSLLMLLLWFVQAVFRVKIP